jgi:hypothetical protein
VNHSMRMRLKNRKRRIERRLAPVHWSAQDKPMFKASNIHYEVAGRARGLGCGGIGAIHLLARQSGLIEAIDGSVVLLKVHLPYHESDHVLSIAYNILAGGDCLEDLELLRNDEVYLDALGAQRIPDPTTARDFCRRFDAATVLAMLEAINRVRLRVWKSQGPGFVKQVAILDADGTIAPTTGQCKAGMDMSYNGQWGYHPLVISLANTQEPLYLVNRSGSRPSSEGAAAYLDRAIALCREAGFLGIRLRGDTDFSQTTKLDEWNRRGVEFLFGIDAMPNLKAMADALPPGAWTPLERPPRYHVQTRERDRPANVKEQLVIEHGYKNIRLESEEVAETTYRPGACAKAYRLVILRKNLSVAKGEAVLFDDIRYFFYLTNIPEPSPQAIVFEANDRCNQENLISQLQSGVKAMRMPARDLVSNWAYMVMASLAWTLKAWLALALPAKPGPWQGRHQQQKQDLLKMEFKTFVNAFMRLPCQIVRQGRRILYRLLSWNPWLAIFLRAVEAIRLPLRC